MNEGISEATSVAYSKLDSLSLLNLLNKYVRIKGIKSCDYEGFIQSIDPITYSLVLLIPKNSAYSSVLIPGHAVTGVVEIKTDLTPPSIETQQCTSEEHNNTLDRKKNLISWLKQNLIPVTEVNDNIVFGNVKILPPYSLDDICTDSTVVAMQIRKLIKQMP